MAWASTIEIFAKAQGRPAKELIFGIDPDDFKVLVSENQVACVATNVKFFDSRFVS